MKRWRRSLIVLLLTSLLSVGIVASASAQVVEQCKIGQGEEIHNCFCEAPSHAGSQIFDTLCYIGDTPYLCYRNGTSGPWTCRERKQSGRTQASSFGPCTHQISALGRGYGGGNAQSAVFAQTYANGYSCSSAWYRPPNHLITAIQLYKWTGSGYGLCKDSGWYSNTVSAWGWILTWDFGSTAPCGTGLYHNAGFGYQWNNGWLGGYLTSQPDLVLYGAQFLAAGSEENSKPSFPLELKEGDTLPVLDNAGNVVGRTRVSLKPPGPPEAFAHHQRPVPPGLRSAPNH